MKKITFMACAAMLTSTVAFTGCKSNDPVGPDLNGEDVVKTEFAISIPSQANNGAKHMPAANLQTTGVFLGMTNMVLIPFDKKAAIEGTDSRLGTSNIVLADGIPASGEGALVDKCNAKMFTNVTIPLRTASFLFYGKSAATGDFENVGKLEPNDLNVTNPSSIEFQLTPIVTDVAGIGTIGTSLIAYLNSIANTTDGATAWKEYTGDLQLENMFGSFSTMHALSSFEVCRTVNDLYNSLNALPASTLKTNLMDAIYNTTTYIKSRTGSGTPADPYVLTLKDDLTGFPENLKLPSGAVRIKYNTTAKEFQACDGAGYDEGNQTHLNLYTYPSSLWYYANSQILTANRSMSSAYVSTNYWKDVLAAYTAESKPVEVNSQTRSVAIKDTIQYAVARLDVTVKAHESLTLKDRNNANITFPNTGIPVTGVLIGNQKNVGFDFTPKGATIYTIYDQVMSNEMKATTSASAANSTLVLETPATAAAADVEDPTADVKIAIELENNSGSDFIGAAGQLIPKNGKFYLVATLKASNATTTQKRVFIKDFTTTANLTIKNLANAYNTIPDLRTPQLELGMSVDLSWTAGSIYNVDFE